VNTTNPHGNRTPDGSDGFPPLYSTLAMSFALGDTIGVECNALSAPPFVRHRAPPSSYSRHVTKVGAGTELCLSCILWRPEALPHDASSIFSLPRSGTFPSIISLSLDII
jgi:hypothetical protein